MNTSISLIPTKWKNVFQVIEEEFNQLMVKVSPTLTLNELDLTDAKIKEQLKDLQKYNAEIDKKIKRSRDCCSGCYCLREKSIVITLIFAIFQTFAQTASQAYETFGTDMTSKYLVLGFAGTSNTLLTIVVVYSFAAQMLQGHQDHLSTLIKEAITQTEKFEEIIAALKEIKQQSENNSQFNNKLDELLSLTKNSSSDQHIVEITNAVKEQNKINTQMDEKINKLLETYKTLPLQYKLNPDSDKSNLSEIISYGIHNLPTDDPIKKDLEEISLPTKLEKVYVATENTKNWDGEKGAPESPEVTNTLVASIFAKINERFNVEIDYIHASDGNMIKKDSFNLQKQESSELKILIEK